MNAMTPIRATSMRRALADWQLLGAAMPGDSWLPWRGILIAGNGERLTDEERIVYTKLTGRAHEPLEPCEETFVVAGRRGGKSRAAAVKAIYASCFVDYANVLSSGESGVVLCLSASQRQASVITNYVLGILEGAPLLASLIKGRSGDAISLRNGIDIEVRSANWRSVRGMTLVCAICDELCFWYDDSSGSANPDSEILAALRPALSTCAGQLLCISSPYARRGEMFETWSKHYGEKGDPRVLVAQGSSQDFNPSLPQRVVDRAYERDPISAASEYGGLWRTDIEAFISREAIVGVTVPGRIELPPIVGQSYAAFTDPSGGSSDSMTLAIAHAEGEVAVLDLVRERHPRFSPADVVDEFTATLKRYGLSEVTGDRYGAEWVREQFQMRGVEYKVSDRVKSAIYAEITPLINSKRVELLDVPRLHTQLLGLERRTSRGSGRDNIDHAPGGHDDVANAACGALVLAAGVGGDGFSVREFVQAYGSASDLEEFDKQRRPAAALN
jgi:hypothetical protein